MEQIHDMSLFEYNKRMEAYRLSVVDRRFEMFLEAFANRSVNFTTQKGKKTVYVYPKLENVFDYDEEVNKVRNNKTTKPKQSSKDLEVLEMMKRFNERNKKGGLNGG